MQGQRRQGRGHPLPVTASVPASLRHTSTGDASDRFMDAGEVASLVGVNRETVLRAWRSGHLPGYAANRKVVRFTRTDIQEWLSGGRRQRSATEPAMSLRPSPRSRPRRRVA